MRVIWLRKKVVEYEPSVREKGLIVYHGTNLPNLYRILKSGKLGSEVGRHTGFYRRVGKFYMTDNVHVAEDYAEDATRDPTYYVPGHRLPDKWTVKENASSLQKLVSYRRLEPTASCRHDADGKPAPLRARSEPILRIKIAELMSR
jgi:hypothetical protein